MNIDENVQKNECSCNTENGKKMMEMLETERKRIVSELHDTSLQNIAHLVHMIELASLYIDKDPARAKMELNSVSKGLHNVIEDIRSTIFNLRPMTFDDLGLKASFERLLDFLNADKDYIMDVEIDDVSCETDDYFCITLYCFLYNKNTNYCRGQSSKLQREFPYYCRVLFGIFLSSQFL